MILLCLLLAGGWTAKDSAARASALLSDVRADYAAAVGPDGALLSAAELEEQLLFVGDAARDLREAGAPELASRVEGLTSLIRKQVPPLQLMAAAAELESIVDQQFKLSVLPPAPPDPVHGREVYLQACAACHGRQGEADPHLDLSSKPAAFSSKEQVARLSPRGIFSAVSFGLPGTAMPEYREGLDERARWDVAFYVLTLAHRDPREVRLGEKLLRAFPRRPAYLQLAVRSDDQLRRALSGSGLSPGEREAIITACRKAPGGGPSAPIGPLPGKALPPP